jgi:hypothetical protein
MGETRRVTVYFDPEIHRALRVKAAVAERTISEMVNEAVRRALAEDAADLAAFADRAEEPVEDFEALVRSLQSRGKL